MTDFEQLVLAMRTAQKTFFRYHDDLDLKKAKELERQVDAALERKQKLDQEPTPTLDLFGGQNEN